MHPDLQLLIELQQATNAIQELQQKLDDIPRQLEACESRIAARVASVETARERIAQGQAARRVIEKDLDEAQRRLTRFKGQLMEVKTNKEYQAMQKEMGVAERDVQAFEDRILELMLEADGLAADVSQAESDLAAEQAEVDAERHTLEGERIAVDRELASHAETRDRIGAAMVPSTRELFESIARGRRGIAVVEARDGHCGSCHVRLRPQLFNDIRLNEGIIQCDSCQRVLYFSQSSASQS